MSRAGFPDIGRTLPSEAVTALGVVAGGLAIWLVVGISGWLAIALALLVAAAAVPRGPFAALLVLQLAVAQTLTGLPGYSGRLALVLLATHLVFATGLLSAWLPRRSRVQLAVLRRPLLRFVAIQVVAQAAAFVVLGLLRRPEAVSIAWLGIVGAGAALVVALAFVVPALLRPTR
ncbi:hypothetical protein AS850_13385 [Frondihabitans sp. 762G35]|uniref:hypothetical protein n=1 Tax=Frondihabitans sp. 762G35 TaxID=1446794 RepID=UPI000D213522|nr:hypothetical protein [Frondihabitans sp. 762G35]ARC58070.1 hypothetical protein AS850_13385 [Frondihabitans sp. 762G35]